MEGSDDYHHNNHISVFGMACLLSCDIFNEASSNSGWLRHGHLAVATLNNPVSLRDNGRSEARVRLDAPIHPATRLMGLLVCLGPDLLTPNDYCCP